MFIAKYPNGEIVTEKQKNWSEIDDGLSVLELTFPIPVTYRDPDTGEEKRASARTISLRGYDKYFFHNEAVAHFDINDQKFDNSGQGNLIAQVIGGIRDNQITQVRIDKGGFCQITSFDTKDFQHSDIKKAA